MNAELKWNGDYLECNGIAVARIYKLRRAHHRPWGGFSGDCLGRAYRSRKRAVRAVERHFGVNLTGESK